jgi:hypothetical protein
MSTAPYLERSVEVLTDLGFDISEISHNVDDAVILLSDLTDVISNNQVLQNELKSIALNMKIEKLSKECNYLGKDISIESVIFPDVDDITYELQKLSEDFFEVRATSKSKKLKNEVVGYKYNSVYYVLNSIYYLK